MKMTELLSVKVNPSPLDSCFRHREYRKSLKSGKKELTKEEFKKVYNSLFAGDASDFAENVFRTFDLDQDGKVDFKEFITGLSESGSSKLQRKLRWAFRMYDINGTGYITWEEMRHIIAVSKLASQ